MGDLKEFTQFLREGNFSFPYSLLNPPPPVVFLNPTFTVHVVNLDRPTVSINAGLNTTYSTIAELKRHILSTQKNQSFIRLHGPQGVVRDDQPVTAALYYFVFTRDEVRLVDRFTVKQANIDHSMNSDPCSRLRNLQGRTFKLYQLICLRLRENIDETLACLANLEENCACTDIGTNVARGMVKVASSRVFAVKEQALVELVTNAVDATVTGRNSVGRFGMGFFSIIAFLHGKPSRHLYIESKTTDCHYALEIFNEGEDFAIVEVGALPHTGTFVCLRTGEEPFTDEEVDLFGKELQRLLGVQGVDIIVNGRKVNFLSEKGPVIIVTVNKTLVSVLDEGTGISPANLLNSLLVPSSSSKGLNVVKDVDEATLQHVNFPQKKAYAACILVNGVAVVQLGEYTERRKMYILSLPSHTRVTLARNDVILPEIDQIRTEFLAHANLDFTGITDFLTLYISHTLVPANAGKCYKILTEILKTGQNMIIVPNEEIPNSILNSLPNPFSINFKEFRYYNRKDVLKNICERFSTVPCDTRYIDTNLLVLLPGDRTNYMTDAVSYPGYIFVSRSEYEKTSDKATFYQELVTTTLHVDLKPRPGPLTLSDLMATTKYKGNRLCSSISAAHVEKNIMTLFFSAENIEKILIQLRLKLVCEYHVTVEAFSGHFGKHVNFSSMVKEQMSALAQEIWCDGLQQLRCIKSTDARFPLMPFHPTLFNALVEYFKDLPSTDALTIITAINNASIFIYSRGKISISPPILQMIADALKLYMHTFLFSEKKYSIYGLNMSLDEVLEWHLQIVLESESHPINEYIPSEIDFPTSSSIKKMLRCQMDRISHDLLSVYVASFAASSEIPIQSVEMIINDGTSRDFIPAVINELLQNSIDAVREGSLNKRITLEVSSSQGKGVLTITDPVGMSGGNILSLLTPFASSKGGSNTATGEMGTGFFNVFRESTYVLVQTQDPVLKTCISCFLSPYRLDGRVLDVIVGLNDDPTPPGTIISIFVEMDAFTLYVKVQQALDNGYRYIDLSVAEIYIVNEGRVINEKADILYTDRVVSVKKKERGSYLLAADQPVTHVMNLCKDNGIDFRLIQRFIEEGKLLTIPKHAFIPSQARETIRLHPDFKTCIERALLQSVIKSDIQTLTHYGSLNYTHSRAQLFPTLERRWITFALFFNGYYDIDTMLLQMPFETSQGTITAIEIMREIGEIIDNLYPAGYPGSLMAWKKKIFVDERQNLYKKYHCPVALIQLIDTIYANVTADPSTIVTKKPRLDTPEHLDETVPFEPTSATSILLRAFCNAWKIVSNNHRDTKINTDVAVIINKNGRSFWSSTYQTLYIDACDGIWENKEAVANKEASDLITLARSDKVFNMASVLEAAPSLRNLWDPFQEDNDRLLPLIPHEFEHARRNRVHGESAHGTVRFPSGESKTFLDSIKHTFSLVTQNGLLTKWRELLKGDKLGDALEAVHTFFQR